MSTYTARIIWKSDEPETFTKNRYTRGHSWEFDGGELVFKNDPPDSAVFVHSEMVINRLTSKRHFVTEKL